MGLLGEVTCNAVEDGFTCTLPKGHGGDVHKDVHASGGYVAWAKKPRSYDHPMSLSLARALDALTDSQWAELSAWLSGAVQAEMAKRGLAMLPDRGIGILTSDNGEYYVSFWDDAKALERAVRALKAQRLDDNREEPDCGVHVPVIRTVPADCESDEFLDVLAKDIEDATGMAIETAEQAAERRQMERDEEDAIEAHLPVAPGQEEMGL